MKLWHINDYIILLPDTPQQLHDLVKICRQQTGRSHGANPPWCVKKIDGKLIQAHTQSLMPFRKANIVIVYQPELKTQLMLMFG